MLLMILTSMMALAPATSPPHPVEVPGPVTPRPEVGRDCPEARAYHAAKVPGAATARRLDQLPPGRLELTVLRVVDGCPIPAVLREGIGAPADPDGREPDRR